MNIPQLYYWARKTARNLIVKPRQKGLSKVIDADQLIDCIRRPINAVVISHEKVATQRLFSAVRFFIDKLEVKPAISIDSKSEIQFYKRGSNYFVGTAGQKGFGHGDTIARAHLSEASRYPDLERIRNGVEETMGMYGQIDIETTANGRDQVYEMWQRAKEGKSEYTPIFIPWFIDQEYSVDNLESDDIKKMSAAVREMISIPNDEFIANLTQEEKMLVKKVAKEWNIILTAGQLKWRRYKIWDKGALFWQEYPEDDVSCFLQTGRSVFTHIICDQSRRIPLDNIESWGTPEQRASLKKRTLYAGVDGAEGTLTGDRHCFAIIDAPPNLKPATVFEIASNEPIDVFWTKVHKITKSFNVRLIIEKNGVGNSHIQMAKRLQINHTPWDTNGTTRPTMITDIEEAWRKEELIETYPEAENEARDMFYNDSNKAEHRPGKHDDRVFGRMLALQGMKIPAPKISFL